GCEQKAAIIDFCDRALDLAKMASAEGGPSLARQAASALYHVVTAAGIANEAQRLESGRRAALVELILRHRLSPVDPLSPQAGDAALNAAVLHDPRSGTA